MRRLVPVVAALSLAQACGHVGAPPHALYAGLLRPAQELAMLSGPIKTVDGLDVSEQGTLFSLEPGCHVVVLESRIGEGGVSGAWSADIPKHIYAFRMTAGNSYVVDVRVLPGNQGVGTANVGGVKVTAVEQDSRGKKIRTIARVRKEGDIEACQAWAASMAGPRPAPPPEEPATEPDAGGQQLEPVAKLDAGSGAGAGDTVEPAANP